MINLEISLMKNLELMMKKNKKIVKLWGDGSPQREFIFSDDLAEAIYIILKTKKKGLANGKYFF